MLLLIGVSAALSTWQLYCTIASLLEVEKQNTKFRIKVESAARMPQRSSNVHLLHVLGLSLRLSVHSIRPALSRALCITNRSGSPPRFRSPWRTTGRILYTKATLVRIECTSNRSEGDTGAWGSLIVHSISRCSRPHGDARDAEACLNPRSKCVSIHHR
ncbi:hypothetical protein BJV78DRAFT_949911 [Lactifluus subvellereus]|nr:hypothetical protein BJV78DRAFT_949911 [Lactifluus subvellereus]